jgi:hypothetical protein
MIKDKNKNIPSNQWFRWFTKNTIGTRNMSEKEELDLAMK